MSAGPADKALDVFHDLVYVQIVKMATDSIIALAPWLAIPPVAWIVTQVVSYVAGVLYGFLRDTVNFEYIMLTNEVHHAAFVKASLDLKAIAAAKGIDSPEFRKARDEHKTALAVFVRNSGT